MIKLREIRKSRGLTMKQLGELVSVTESAIGQYETGRRAPNYEMLLRLSEALGCSVDDILNGEKEPHVQQSPAAPQSDVDWKFQALDEHGKRLVMLVLNAEFDRCFNEAHAVKKEVKYIRHYLSRPAAGLSGLAGDEYEDIILPDDAPKGADFCLTVSGDSMEPYLHDGQMVYVSQVSQIEDFDVGIFGYQGATYVKQLCRGMTGEIYLLSANPAREDKNIIIGRDDIGSLVCFGKVLLPHRLPKPVYY